MRILVGLVSCVLLGLCLWFWYASDSMQSHKVSNELIQDVPSSAIVIKNITLHEYSKKRDYELIVHAQQSTSNQRLESVECLKVTCTVFKNDQNVSTWRAEQACIDRHKKEITCSGSVAGIIGQCAFQGYDLIYNFDDESCVINGGVRMEFSQSPTANNC